MSKTFPDSADKENKEINQGRVIAMGGGQQFLTGWIGETSLKR